MKFIGQVVSVRRNGREHTIVTLCGINGDSRTFEIEVKSPFAEGYEIGRRVVITVRTRWPKQRWE